MKTHADIAKQFGCTPQQVRAQKQRNGASIRRYSDAQLRRWGKTREQANKIADDYE